MITSRRPLASRKAPLILAASIAGLLLGHSAHAADRYWDTTTASGLGSGTATWSTSDQTWSSSSAGTSNPLLVWTDGSDAFFQTGGTNVVTVSGTVVANSITQTV